MSGPMKMLRLVAAALVVSGGLIVASCGGSSVNTTPVATATSAPSVQSIPVGGGNLTVASSSSQVATLGFTAGAPAGIQLTASSSTTSPANAPVVTALKRTPDSGPIAGAVPFFYVTFSVSANLSTQFLSSETVTLGPSNPATATYGVEFVDMSTTPPTALGDAGPATISGLLATFVNGSTANAPTLTAGHTYLMMFFYIPSGTATPSPSASTSPSPGASSSASPSPAPSGSASSGPTSPPLLVFHGSTDTVSMSPTQMPIPMTLALYQNITFTNIQWQPTLSGSGSLTISDATNNGDITGGTLTPFTGTGTAVMYLEFTATTTLSFPATPTVTLTDASPFPGAGTCAFFGYINNGGAPFSWQQVNTSFTASTGNGPYTVTLPAVTAAQVGGQIQFQATPFYGAIVCK